jgi:PPM family protein phosphatase
MIYYAKTHKGSVRHNNEDAYFVPGGKGATFAIVADGMGGHNAGEIASRIVVDTFRSSLKGIKPQDVNEEVLQGIFSKANERVLADSEKNPDRSGMGSTATAAIFAGCHVMIGHVGDSRAYLYHAGGLKQITQDHSYVQMLLNLGYISEQQAAGHPQKNVITRAVGTDTQLKADIFQVDLCKGDCLLLCSDGLNVMVSDECIAEILGGGFKNAAERLVKAALEGGGADNITVVLAVKEGDGA